MTQTKYNKAVSVCFSGHSNIPFPCRKQLKQRLKAEIVKAYTDGYRHFYCGMAMGFDMLAAEVALSLQSELSDLQVIAVIPHRGQTERWNDAMKAKYEAILHSSDDVIMLSEHYYHGCLLRRNDYMVLHSSCLISWYDGKPKGGTFYTCRKAAANGLKVINLYDGNRMTGIFLTYSEPYLTAIVIL